METAYVVQNGATLRRNGDVFEVWAERKRVATIVTRNLGQLVLMGNVMVTPACMDIVIERGIDLVFLSHHGRFRARVVGEKSTHVALRLAQLEFVRTPENVMAAARAVVLGKIANQRVMLMRGLRRTDDAERARRAIVAMNASVASLGEMANLDQVRGCEGAASAAYFRGFSDLVRGSEFTFDGRNRRPPIDPVNAMLSLGYTLLMNAVESSVHVVGLDPSFGTLHAPQAGRASLACDLVEEFRAPIVDALVLAAIHHRAMTADDFEEGAAGEPVVMKREALKHFVRLFERRLERRLVYEPLGVKLAFRGVIEQQVRRFARAVLGTEPYEAWTVR